ncbi:Peptidoglycan/xylan/chitin deacetylase, PgdA/CDA1 family [Desulfonispora thiosulfatigenes DSM 11270]|uniref:Peptidoglycan/xylan/chitin deacetylase, PgdA/CDA1 family n=1 Tax=Desulfonispora thiosulfatigenes DSM 11270 TaxID=656914 RepID=A0A1W1VL73_DESTI|nr:polysaccharide deacetylase family protein [Desulfonispora thiosulfatigenes]SMB94135.1 Peptidoglycan/xylan/chitin deacetylase, PgdA/CDA1 family [Desulfonispora thiosulfatigenes DSM 11270]
MKFILLSKKRLVYGAVVVLISIIALAGMFIMLSKDAVPTLQMDPYYQGNINDPNVALTINVDWGEEIIPGMLDVLKEKNVKATFFITGRFADKFPDIIKTIVKEGHEIGNHGYSHPHPDQISVEENKNEILKTHNILKNFTDDDINLFAPPYGERGQNCLNACKELGYKTILWTADTVDWQVPAPSVSTLVERVTGKKLTNGAIILMHPKAHTLEALPQIIETIEKKGYVLKKVSEIL